MPPLIAWTILLSVLLIGLALWALLNFCARRSELAMHARRRLAVVSGTYLVLWLLLATALGGSGVLSGTAGGLLAPIAVGAGIAFPLLVGVLLLYRSATLNAVISVVPLPWLVGVQLYRVIGAIFLVLYTRGQLPAEFALPAGWGDVAVGLSAPVVAIVAFQELRGSRLAVSTWNALGILDLLVALATGLPTAPSPLQRLALDSPNEMITTLPLVLVPLFVVPLSIMLHLTVFKRQGVLPTGTWKRLAASVAPAQRG